MAIAGLVSVGSASVASAEAAEPPPAPGSALSDPLGGLLGGVGGDAANPLSGIVGGGGVSGQPAGIGSALNSATGGTDLLSQLGSGLTGGLGGGAAGGLGGGLFGNFIKGLGISDVLNSGKLPDSSAPAGQ